MTLKLKVNVKKSKHGYWCAITLYSLIGGSHPSLSVWEEVYAKLVPVDEHSEMPREGGEYGLEFLDANA